MNRRDFLSRAGLLGGGLAVGQPAWATTATAAAPDAWAKSFAKGLVANPKLLGFASASEDFPLSDCKIEGKLPAALRGTLYRNGPAQHEVGGVRYHHWFDADGLVHGWRLTDKGVQHHAKFVQTKKRMAERQAGRMLYDGFGTHVPGNKLADGADDVNAANISVLPVNGRLFATWEGGSPYEIDPETLETKGIHYWDAFIAGAPFSAHSKIDPNGTIWNVGYAASQGMLVLWHIDAKGKMVKRDLVPLHPTPMIHDFVITQRYLVVPCYPVLFEPSGERESFLSANKWHAEQSTRILIFDKKDFSLVAAIEDEAGFAFHHGNAWDDGKNIFYDVALRPNPDIMFKDFVDLMRGKNSQRHESPHVLVHLDLQKKTASHRMLLDGANEFPVVDPQIVGLKHRTVVSLVAKDEWLAGVQKTDVDSGKNEQYFYPEHEVPEEHLYLPEPGKPETGGFIIGTSLDVLKKHTYLNIFDATKLADGPIARATLPKPIPLGFHGKFVAT